MRIGPDTRALVRCAAMIAGSVVLFGAGYWLIFHDDSRLWMAPVLLSVVLAFRAAYDAFQIDRVLAITSVVTLAAGGIGAAAWGNAVEHDDAELRTRAIIFFAVAAAAALATVWRVARVVRDDPQEG